MIIPEEVFVNAIARLSSKRRGMLVFEGTGGLRLRNPRCLLLGMFYRWSPEHDRFPSCSDILEILLSLVSMRRSYGGNLPLY